MRRLAALVCCVAMAAIACSGTDTASPTDISTSTPSSVPQPSPTHSADLPVDEPTPSARAILTPQPSDPNCVNGVTHIRTSDEVYEGVCWGWRVGPENFDTGDTWSQKAPLDCDAKLYGNSIETSGPPWEQQLSDLDISMLHVPSGATFQHVGKWTCATHGLSDQAILTLAPVEDAAPVQVEIERWLDNSRWLVVDTSPGSVHSCRIARLPAICIENIVPVGAFVATTSLLFVLEDTTLDPNGIVLRLYADDMRLDELTKIAELVVRR